MVTQVHEDVKVTGGVDTHADVHVAAAIDRVGRELGHAEFPTSPDGYAELLAWLDSFGELVSVGVEGTGMYGAGLTRLLQATGVVVVEVDRPDRKARRFQGKSDPIDAYAAARAALSGRAAGTPKTRTGTVEMIRMIRVARAGAVKAKAIAWNELKALIKTAPESLRERLRGLDGASLLDACTGLRPARGPAPVHGPHAKRRRPGVLVDPTAACKRALSTLARRIRTLEAEIADLDDDLRPLIEQTAPTLLSLHGVGLDVAGQLLATVGDNPDRLRDEAAFAHLCGVSPIPASSGKTNKHRLNRGGDRGANNALWRIAMVRLRYDPRTRAYRDRRAAEQKTNKDIMRCLKRYIAREVFDAILTDLARTASPAHELQKAA
jgi:transposase